MALNQLPTARQLQILQLAANGLSTKEIGVELNISVKTINNHLTECFVRLDVMDRTHAVAVALRKGWVK